MKALRTSLCLTLLLGLPLSVGCSDGTSNDLPSPPGDDDNLSDAKKKDMATPAKDLAMPPKSDLTAGSGALRFAVFGDTRPGGPTGVYPTAVAQAVFAGINRMAVQFVVVTGDYIYVTGTDPTAAAAQMDLFLSARTELSADVPVHYVLGNHEANNIPTFESKLSPQTYWSFTQGNAKFVAIANDDWSSTQSSWLDSQLSVSSTYTFVFRHQYWDSSGTTHESEIKPIVMAHPFTLFLAGHDHAYSHKTVVTRGAARDVVCGTGGAPFDANFTNPYYGFLLLEEQKDGTIQVTSYKVEPGMDVAPVAMDTFNVTP